MAAKDELGRRGEQLAAEHVQARGMAVLDRNWRCATGEIDLVARDGEQLVFIEVKTRAGLGFGHPLEAITQRKLARLRQLAVEWCRAHPDARGSVRIDAIGIVIAAGRTLSVEHLAGVH